MEPFLPTNIAVQPPPSRVMSQWVAAGAAGPAPSVSTMYTSLAAVGSFARMSLQLWPEASQVPHESFVFVSQPFWGLPSQSAYPAAHRGTHAPAEHEVVPWSFAHARPHAPQLVTLVPRSLSQPFDCTPSQLAHPVSQVATVHVIDGHVVVVACGSAQTTPQPPQLFTWLSDVSQPLTSLASQLPQPVVQESRVHEPPGQLVRPFARAQPTPQPPQFVVVWRLASQPLLGLPSQLAVSVLQAGAQAPDWHVVGPFGLTHEMLQAPQVVRLLASSDSQPLVATPSQLAKPASHWPSLHVPVAHDSMPLARSQVCPHAPQVSVESSEDSQPFEMSPSQSA